MRIVWNNDRFEAEVASGEHFRDDIETIKAAGFKTSGPPQWQWYALKATPINKLRENKPKSGLTLTQLALDKYKQLDQQEQQKAALKKQYQKLRKEADKQAAPKPEEYFDELGFMCIKVEPSKTTFVPQYLPSKIQPTGYCIVCGDPIYGWPDYADICMWCDNLEKNKLTNSCEFGTVCSGGSKL